MSKTAAIYFQIPKTPETDALKRRVAVLAAEQGRSQGEIVLEALKAYLEAQKAK